jgi:hypothetical protein
MAVQQQNWLAGSPMANPKNACLGLDLHKGEVVEHVFLQMDDPDNSIASNLSFQNPHQALRVPLQTRTAGLCMSACAAARSADFNLTPLIVPNVKTGPDGESLVRGDGWRQVCCTRPLS